MGCAGAVGSLTGVLAGAILLAGPAAGLETIEEIRSCMRANAPERTSRQKIELRARDRAGGIRTLDAQLEWKRFDGSRPRVRIRVEDPPDLRGAAYLLIEGEGDRHSDVYMYLPAAQRVRRVAAGAMGDQLWGTDFSYDDIRQLQWIAAEGATERLPDSAIDGRPTYVLTLDPAAESESPYRRIVTYVDHETCLNLKIEFYERGEQPRKVLSADPSSFARSGEYWFARELEMQDLRDGTTSWLKTVKVEHDVTIQDRVFNPTFLDRVR